MKKFVLLLFSVLAFALSAASVAEDKYLAAAEKGDAEAQYLLSKCYTHGLGVKKDPEQALYWLRKSAEQGYSEAQCVLGLRYILGLDVKKDYGQGFFWLHKSAEQGNVNAQSALGVCYFAGDASSYTTGQILTVSGGFGLATPVYGDLAKKSSRR